MSLGKIPRVDFYINGSHTIEVEIDGNVAFTYEANECPVTYVHVELLGIMLRPLVVELIKSKPQRF